MDGPAQSDGNGYVVNRAVNIRQVARAASVSVATVSRALQTPDVVAPTTRERVLSAIRELGYTPNAQARNLRTSRTGLVIALVPDIANPFFSQVIRGIEKVAHKAGYSVLLGDTQYDVAREQAYARLIESRQADGLITLLPRVPVIKREGPVPIVNACEYVSDPTISSVYVDNVAGALSATNYLLTLGHRDIGFISGPSESPLSRDRHRGYVEALQAAGLRADPSLVVQGDFSAESGARAVDTLVARGATITAIFCSSDEMALGAMSAVGAKGMIVPRDVSIVGFDDLRLSRFFGPPLTTIAQPKDELGSEAMTILLDLLKDPLGPARRRMLPTQLVVRGSTAAPKRQP